MALVEVDHLTVRFGGLTAINDLSFTTEEGSITALIGPNGAGKTTAFNCLTGFYKPTEGDVRFDGKSLSALKPHEITALGIIRTFQNVRLFKRMSVMENVMSGPHSITKQSVFGALFHGPAQKKEEAFIRQTALESMEFAGIADLGDSIAQDLPYGLQRRVELARAIAAKPRLMLLDEPAAGLNDAEKEELIALIRRCRDELGITVFLIEHDMDMIMNLAEKIVVISFGSKIAEGTPNEVKNDSVVIEAYLGSEDEPA